MEELVGSKILDIEINEDDAVNNYAASLKFTTDKGIFIYDTAGDCCSDSWFSEIINLDFLINHSVSEVSELNFLNDENNPNYSYFKDGNSRQSRDLFYGYSIATEAGHTTIVFRNSSNGYYGGWCDLREKENFEIEATKPSNWTSIKDMADWTAYEPTPKSFNHYLKLKAFW